MRYWHKFATDTKEGFDLMYFASYEDIPLRHLFDDEEEIKELAKQIDNGDLEYFCVKCEVYKAGIKLAEDHLGGCIYESYDDFTKDGYYSDMAYEAIAEAKQNLKELLKDLENAN